MKVRVRLVALATTAAVAVASPIAAGARPASHAVVAATRDDVATLMHFALQRDLRLHPRVTRAALARVKSRPLFFQLMYVSGAIGSTTPPPAARREMCTVAKSDPARFDAATRKIVFLAPSDYAYVQSKGWSVSSVVTTYRQGVVFGCGLRPE